MKTIMRCTRFIRGIRGLVIAIALICMAATDPAFSQDPTEPRYTLDEAVVLVKQSVGGEVLRAVVEQKDGRTIYEIRVLTDDGLVRDLIFDAENGLEK